MSEAWPPLGPGLNDFGGDWTAFEADCYRRYERDFYGTKPTWPVDQKRFAIKRQPTVDGMCHTFWHIITEGDSEEERLPEMGRCECVEWARHIIDEFALTYPAPSSSRICWWIEPRGGASRYHIALADFSYLVVVEDRSDYVLLWTAFPVERDHQRRRRRTAFEKYWSTQGEGRP